MTMNIDLTDCPHPIIQFLEDPSQKIEWKVKMRVIRYVIIGDKLYKRGFDDLLLRCLGKHEVELTMAEVHRSVCGNHHEGVKMKALILRHYHY